MDRKNEKREKIIDVSLKLFVENGFHGTPTSLIAKEAGVATGTLFNYFKTKDILINEIFKEIKIEQKEKTLEGIAEEKKLKLRLKKIWSNLIIWGLENPKKLRFIEYFNNSYHITDDTRTEIQRNYKFLIILFRKIIKEKKLENTDELMLILSFMGNCIYAGKYFHITRKKYDEKLADEPFERFCKSINLTEEDQ